MRFSRLSVVVSILLGLSVIGLVGLGEAGAEKQLVLVFTTDTSGELNPCG